MRNKMRPHEEYMIVSWFVSLTYRKTYFHCFNFIYAHVFAYILTSRNVITLRFLFAIFPSLQCFIYPYTTQLYFSIDVVLTPEFADG